mmetsp:Transcript_1567/g.2366  ORF Transcript_1567/g.2366 Transcript_1567/m.2366 type:complete len:675 (-) Transcript_1567:1013-3037(-)
MLSLPAVLSVVKQSLEDEQIVWPPQKEGIVQVEKEWKNRIEKVQKLRRLKRKREEFRLNRLEEKACDQAIGGILLKSRLSRQLKAAELRLDELIAECYGEKEKRKVGFKAQIARQHAEGKERSTSARVDAAWDLFLIRLAFESGAKEIKSISKYQSEHDISLSRAILPDNLQAQLQPVRCATIHKLGARRLANRGIASAEKNGFFFTSGQTLCESLKKMFPSPNENVNLDEPLFTVPIFWLALAASDHCYENNDSDHLNKTLVRNRIFVMQDGMLLPAQVRHLLESKFVAQKFALGNTNQLPSSLNLATVSALYIILGSTPLHNGHLNQQQVIPVVLKETALKLLIEFYTPHLASSLFQNTTAIAHLALPPTIKYFSILKNNANHTLVAWQSSTISTTTTLPKDLPCDWRACSAPTTVWLKKCGLCEWHASLKAMIDSEDTDQEHSKKKSHRYLSSIHQLHHKRSSSKIIDSALLKELTDGKLAATVKAFCSRATKESQAKKLKEHKKLPRWLRWTDEKALEKAQNALHKSLQLAETIAAIEKACAVELSALAAAGKLQDGRVLDLLHRQRQRFDLNDHPISESDIELPNIDSTPLKNEERLEFSFARAKLSLLRAAHTGDNYRDISDSSTSLKGELIIPPKPQSSPMTKGGAISATNKHQTQRSFSPYIAPVR